MSTTMIKLPEQDAAPHILSLISDITDRKELEEHYILSRKLESLGRMAGGIAHNINNLLTGISGNLDLAISDAGPNPSRFLSNANKAANRAAELVDQLLAFCRKVKLDLKHHQVNDSVQEVVEWVQQTLEPGITLKMDLQEDMPLVLADAAQLHSVLMNLCVNAIHAIHEKQKSATPGNLPYEIQLSTKQEFRSGRKAPFCMIEITDNGAGMKSDVVEHIFEPFFTTKGANGTGLGLASAFGVIQGHRGWIECKSRNGKGATFRIYIPTVE